MKSSTYDRIEDYLIKAGKKHKFAIPFILIALTIVFAVSRIGLFFARFYRRIGLIFLVLGLFTIGLSVRKEEPHAIVDEEYNIKYAGELTFSDNENSTIENEAETDTVSKEMEATDFSVNDKDTKAIEVTSNNLIDVQEETDIETVKNELQDKKFDKSDWQLILVNKQHPIPDDYIFELTSIKGQMQCDTRVKDNLDLMIEKANNDGYKLKICSPYRDEAKQSKLFSKKINKYMKDGYSYMEAYKLSAQTVTVPGTSEHEIGLAFDIVSTSYTSLNAGFGNTKEGKWLNEHCDEYGFIIRYPEGKEYITGIEYEPWHLRYVGVDAASIIMNNNLCLEEFWDKYL